MSSNKYSVWTLPFIAVMIMFAAGSGGPSRNEVLAKKYDVSESEAQACLDIFSSNAEEVLDWISKQSGILGFGNKDCADLRKEITVYGSVEYLLYALKNELDPDDQKFKDYVASKNKELKAQQEAERKAAEEAAKAAAKFEEDVNMAINAGVKAKSVAVSEAVYKEACKRDWKACLDNEDYINIHGTGGISVYCKSQAEKYAKGEVDWGGWLEPNFGTYLTGTSIHDSGTITIIDDVAKFQNGFGAMINTTTYCKVDVVNDKVIEVYFR